MMWLLDSCRLYLVGHCAWARLYSRSCMSASRFPPFSRFAWRSQAGSDLSLSVSRTVTRGGVYEPAERFQRSENRRLYDHWIMYINWSLLVSTVLPRLSVPWLSETSIIRTQLPACGVCLKNGILTEIADSATEQSTCVCVSYVHVQCRHTVVRHRVQCEVKRPSDATFVHSFML